MKKVSILAVLAAASSLLPAVVSAQTADLSVSPTVVGTNTVSSNTNAGVSLPGKKVRTRKIFGTVVTVNGTSISITNKSGAYTVDASAAKLIRRFGATMTAADVQTNDVLEITGTVSGNAVTAKLIRDNSLQAKSADFSGTVSAVNGTSFTLHTPHRSDQVINTDSTTVVKKNGKADQFSDITVGATIKVNGVWDRTNSNVTAKTINIIVRLRPISFGGTLSAVSGATLTVTDKKGTAYNVDASNARLVRKYNGKSNISEFNVGDKVQVQGKHINTSTDVTASLVRDLSITSKTVSASTIGTGVTATTSAQ